MENHAQVIYSKTRHLIAGLDAKLMAHSSILTAPELPAFFNDELRDRMLTCAYTSSTLLNKSKSKPFHHDISLINAASIWTGARPCRRFDETSSFGSVLRHRAGASDEIYRSNDA